MSEPQNYQYSAEGQKRHQNFSTSTGNNLGEINLWYSLAKLLPVLVCTGAAPRRVSTSRGKKSVSQSALGGGTERGANFTSFLRFTGPFRTPIGRSGNPDLN